MTYLPKARELPTAKWLAGRVCLFSVLLSSTPSPREIPVVRVKEPKPDLETFLYTPTGLATVIPFGRYVSRPYLHTQFFKFYFHELLGFSWESELKGE